MGKRAIMVLTAHLSNLPEALATVLAVVSCPAPLRGTQVGQHCEDAPVIILALGNAELHEHVAHVRLDRALAQV